MAAALLVWAGTTTGTITFLPLIDILNLYEAKYDSLTAPTNYSLLISPGKFAKVYAINPYFFFSASSRYYRAACLS